ncbi:MAG TPA: hypothetical protein PLI06_03840 [Methanofastidiosum sp.]|jgi:hypothetical protein|nr:hypothetical protein [Bacteroidales bacterium]HNR45362.1 hypothetical protein [Methanofastidiosum sp.]HNU62442.1 hypothetical protein [Methanofastidiosum sp.]HOI76727.1 hypothetical protein [Methanofastidiosum sp.]
MITNAPKCPECGLEKIVVIVYGIPGHGLLENSQKGEFILGDVRCVPMLQDITARDV